MTATVLDAPEQAANPLADYVAVRAATLRSYDVVAADLFVQYEPKSAPVLYCRAGSCPGAEQFSELEQAGVHDLYVRSHDFGNFGSGLMESLDALLRNDSVSSVEKFAAVQLAVAVAMDHALRLVDCTKLCGLATQVGHEVVSLIADGQIRPRELFRAARHDFNTFTHVTNVAGYCVMLAERLGVSDPHDLQKIASGAILHDVGKRFIPGSIIAKRGRLTLDERKLIETHPLRGYEELCEQPGFDFGQLMMVYQHHEHVDGSGYPVRILGHEIHPWARMLAVVDVFDTMTAARSSVRPATPERVLDHQQQLAGKHFDREVVECWVSAMKKT